MLETIFQLCLSTQPLSRRGRRLLTRPPESRNCLAVSNAISNAEWAESCGRWAQASLNFCSTSPVGVLRSNSSRNQDAASMAGSSIYANKQSTKARSRCLSQYNGNNGQCFRERPRQCQRTISSRIQDNVPESLLANGAQAGGATQLQVHAYNYAKPAWSQVWPRRATRSMALKAAAPGRAIARFLQSTCEPTQHFSFH